MSGPLLSVKDLHVTIPTQAAEVKALRGVTFNLMPGEVLGIVGESGGGKSMIARAITHLLPHRARLDGDLVLSGVDLRNLTDGKLREMRGGGAALCFQSPRMALSPTRKIGKQIADRLRAHGTRAGHLGRQEIRARAIASLAEVGLQNPAIQAGRFPHELSGGMAQRAMIALALACNPQLLIADEPTTGLDATLTGDILKLIATQAGANGRGVIIISHDLAALSTVCSRMIVVQDGRVVETGPTDRLISAPRDDYTKRLIAAVPDVSAHQEAVIPTPSSDPLMQVENLTVAYKGRFRRTGHMALRDVTLNINKGQTVAIVGESGSGKSTLSRAMMGMLQVSTGRILFHGTNLARADFEARRRLHRYMQMVFQDPHDALNPKMRVDDIISDPLRLVESDAARRSAAIDRVLNEVGLDPSFRHRRPHQLSGGQAQRVGIARALATDPELVVLDEPTSALDVTVQAQILDLIRRLTERRDRAYVMVSHDLPTVRALCDRVVVIDAGRVIEDGPTENIFTSPRAAKTRALLDAVPHLHR